MPPKPPRLDRLISVRDLPIRYLFIPKCGCTFVKNLIWRLDLGENYADPPRIHDRDAEFARASLFDLTVEDVRAEEHAFVVLRNPVDRFLSLYFDKVVGEGYRQFVPLRAVLRDHHGLNVDATEPQEHLRNCHIMIDWIEENVTGKNELARDAHWTPQHFRTDLIRAFDLKVLTLNGLDGRLSLLLSDIVPDIGQILKQLERYSTNSKTQKDHVLDSAIKTRINQVYKLDRENYEKLRDVWRQADPKTGHDIPRASQIFD